MPEENTVFQALADPSRRKILRLLQKRDLTPGDMLPHFSMTKPSLSHHLDILKKADLVYIRRAGQNIVYSINASVFEETISVLLELLGRKRR